MNNHRRILDVSVLTICLFVASTTNVYAYIDPGSGGVLITAILGFFAAIGYTFRKWFYKLRNVFGGSKTAENDHDEDKDDV